MYEDVSLHIYMTGGSLPLTVTFARFLPDRISEHAAGTSPGGCESKSNEAFLEAANVAAFFHTFCAWGPLHVSWAISIARILMPRVLGQYAHFTVPGEVLP